VYSKDPDVDAFGGAVGRVLRETLSPGTFLTGFTLLVCLGTLGFIMSRFGAEKAFTFLAQIGLTLAVVRFALNGFAGEWGGTIYSNRGGPWSEVAMVSLRFLTLSAIWLVPIYLLGWQPGSAGEALGAIYIGAEGGKALILSTIAIMLAAITPPIFLIVAVSAQQFSDLWNRNHWEFLFRGRFSNLFLVYTIYLGALTLLGALLLPLLTSIFVKSQDLATILGLGCLAFGLGLSVNLLGRLCGFFASFYRGEQDWAPETEPIEPEPTDEEEIQSPRFPEFSPTEESPPEPALAVVTSMPVASGTVTTPSGKTPLLDARERMDELEERFETDPEGVLKTLEELHEGYAPHPLVLHGLCVFYFQSGRETTSMEVALEALPLCLERGALKLASEIYALHLPRVEELDLHRDTALVLADVLRKANRLAAAEEGYLQILEQDKGERRAIKGLIQVAENHLSESAPERARRIYLLLLEKAGSSPLAIHIEQGLEEAERRINKAS